MSSAWPTSQRYSNLMLRPCFYPNYSRPWRKAASRACVSGSVSDVGGMIPMRRIRSPCCARAASGHETATPPRSAMNFRRLMGLTLLPKTPDERRLSYSEATPVVRHSKIWRPMFQSGHRLLSLPAHHLVFISSPLQWRTPPKPAGVALEGHKPTIDVPTIP